MEFLEGILVSGVALGLGLMVISYSIKLLLAIGGLEMAIGKSVCDYVKREE